MRLSAVLLLIIIFSCRMAEAGITRPISLYTVPSGRAAAMGGAYTAIAEGGLGQRWNPAGVGSGTEKEGNLAVSFMKNDVGSGWGFGDFDQNNYNYYFWGAKYKWENLGLGLYWIRCRLSIERRSALGTPKGSFDAGDDVIPGSIAYKFGNLVVGGNLTVIHQKMITSRWGLTGGGGLILSLKEWLKVGGVIRNWGKVKKDKLEEEGALGVVFHRDVTSTIQGTGTLDWVHGFKGSSAVRGGGEVTFGLVSGEEYSLRLGGAYDHSYGEEDLDVNVGIGIKQNVGRQSVNLDAVFLNSRIVTQLQFTISLDF